MPRAKKGAEPVPVEPEIHKRIPADIIREAAQAFLGWSGGTITSASAAFAILEKYGWLCDPNAKAQPPIPEPKPLDTDSILAAIKRDQEIEEQTCVFVLPVDPPQERGFVVVLRDGKMVKVPAHIVSWRAADRDEIHFKIDGIDVMTAERWP